MFQQIDHIPAGLLDTPADKLKERLGKPALIHLTGRQSPGLFVAVLMHGNETTGWQAMCELLKQYQPGGGEKQLPRDLSLLIGNVDAAAANVRRLTGQPDYNRVWPGSEEAETAEHQMMKQIVEILRQKGLFASVDIHNNTGLNPHYACINVIDHRFLHLATLFSRTTVYFTSPRGVLSQALAELCPSVTLECGKSDQAHGTNHAMEYIDACLHLSQHPEHPVAEHDIDLFHTVARVTIPPSVHFGFDTPDADLNLSSDIETFNFQELPAGTSLGVVKDLISPVSVTNEDGEEHYSHFFNIEHGELRLRKPIMPSMLTTNTEVIRQDCLCYLMERYHIGKQP